MNQTLTPAGESAVSELAGRYGVSTDAVRTMLDAVNNGRGSMAQFNIPELGGSGQWMRGGMTMVGNMFDHNLKARVDGLCRDLSAVLAQHQVYPAPTADSGSFGGGTSGGSSWWPAELGNPASSGGQNGSQYAVFPGTRRLAVLAGGELAVYDIGDHSIGGVRQQQGSGPGSLEFTSQFGTFVASSLPRVDVGAGSSRAQSFPNQNAAPQSSVARNDGRSNDAVPVSGRADVHDITAAIEALAGLHAKGFLTDEEFFTKKSELLGRL